MEIQEQIGQLEEKVQELGFNSTFPKSIDISFKIKIILKSLTLTHRATGGPRHGELFKDHRLVITITPLKELSGILGNGF